MIDQVIKSLPGHSPVVEAFLSPELDHEPLLQVLGAHLHDKTVRLLQRGLPFVTPQLERPMGSTHSLPSSLLSPHQQNTPPAPQITPTYNFFLETSTAGRNVPSTPNKDRKSGLCVAKRSVTTRKQHWLPRLDAKYSGLSVIALESFKQFSKIFYNKWAADVAHKYMEMNGVSHRKWALISHRRFQEMTYNFLIR